MKNKSFVFILAILLTLPLFCLASCEPNPDILPNARFVAKVTEVGETQLFVTVIDKGTSGLGNGTPAYVSIPSGNSETFVVGDYVIVDFDSMVQEIYPPIVPNVFYITKCDATGIPLK